MTSREEVFTQAAEAFRKALDRPGLITSPDLSHADYGSVLTLHMAALASVYESHPTREDLSTYLLEHERRHWPVAAPTSEGVTRSQAEDSVFLATLFGPLPDAEAAQSVLAAAGITQAALTWHDTLYPQEPSDGTFPALAPLRPDRFGEDYVAQRLTTDPRSAELLHRLLDLDLLGEDSIRRCLIVLAAAADRHEAARPTLWALLDHRHLAAHASAAVIQTVIDHAPLPTCQAIEGALPRYRTDLLQAVAALTAHNLDNLPSTTPAATRASYLNNLGARLAQAGNYQAALESGREAVDLYRELVEDDPTCFPDLAGSLNNLGNHLAMVGDEEAAAETARQAVTIRRALVEVDSAYLPNLAAGLNNLGRHLAMVGEKEAALAAAHEAVSLWRELAAVDSAYLSDLAMGLNNLALWVADGQEIQSALENLREAVAIRSALAQENPAVHLPGLAKSLTNLGFQLAEMGDKQAALEPAGEAAAILRLLAEGDPVAHVPDLACSLRTFAWGQMVGSGQPSSAPDEALGAAEEACRLYEDLAREWPDRFDDDLRLARATLAKVRSAVRQPVAPDRVDHEESQQQ